MNQIGNLSSTIFHQPNLTAERSKFLDAAFSYFSVLSFPENIDLGAPSGDCRPGMVRHVVDIISIKTSDRVCT